MNPYIPPPSKRPASLATQKVARQRRREFKEKWEMKMRQLECIGSEQRGAK